MKLTKAEKRELKKEGALYLSVDVGQFQYEEHLALQKKLRRFKIRCSTVPGGTAIHPDSAARVRKARRICKRFGAYLKSGVTYRMSFTV